jgi:putative ABC transport system permease protein
MDRLDEDLRHAARALIRRPLFTFVAVLSLAVGVGATTAVFSIANTLLIQPLPGIRHADRLVEVGRGYRGSGYDSFSFPDLQALKEQVPAFEHLAVFDFSPASFGAGGEGFQILAADVSAAYFTALGVTAVIGRLFSVEEDAPWGAHPVAVVDHRFWQERLGGDPGVVGSTITVNRTSLTVVGVLPPEFRGHVVALRPQVYLPLSMVSVLRPQLGTVEHPNNHWFFPIGRLAEGATIEGAQVAASTVFDRLRAERSELYENKTVHVRAYGPLPSVARDAVRIFMALLMTLAGLVLLVTCANVAGMLLVRATDRERELAVRAALGAGRVALIRRLLVEALALFVVGGAVGAGLAYGLVGLITAVPLPVPIPLDLRVETDLAVLLFALVVTLVAGVASGLAPALPASRPELVPMLKEGGRGRSLRGGRMRRLFVVAQVSLSLVLMVAAGLFLRSLESAGGMQTGFDPKGVYLVKLDLSLEGYGRRDGQRFVRDVLERVRSIPGVTAAAASRDLPMDLASWGNPYWEEGTWDGEGRPPSIGSDVNIVAPGYFETLRIPVLRGRTFTDADDATAEPVVVVSRTLAERAWPDGMALGRRIRFYDGTETAYTVVGVVEDVKNQLLVQPDEPMAYRAYAQWYAPEVTLVARTTPGATGVPAALRRAILELDPALALTETQSLDRVTAIGIMPQRIAAWLAAALGLLAVFLSGLGIYGVVAYTFARRTREVGIRMAVGARRADIGRLVLRFAAGLILPGVLVGGVAGVALAFLVRGFLIGVRPLDLPTFAGVAAVLAAVVVAATIVPARRAATVQPMEALRSE